MDTSSIDESHDSVAAIARITAVPTLLAVACEMTGMRVAMVARIRGKTWTVCAVQDDLQLGIRAGEALALRTNLSLESQPSREPIVIERASLDPRFRKLNQAKLYQIESFISVPIFLTNGHYFGTLCALDPNAVTLEKPYLLSTFRRFATLIAAQLEQPMLQASEHRLLLDERATGERREQFVAVLGHELRNPLQAISAIGHLLQRKLTDPVLARVAARIQTNSRRMSLLIDEVLDLSRSRLGNGISVELAEVADINTGLMDVIRELQDANPAGMILSNVHVNHPVQCDLGRLQQVASNLVANALTHGQPLSPISISARTEAADLVLEVWNAGKPIPSESLDKIFEPFWRHSTSVSRHGLGLGLHICAEIVRAHHGQISVVSSAKGGTQFTARLPLGGPLPTTFTAIAHAPCTSVLTRTRLNGDFAPTGAE